ncbi:MAG: hypothetical protein L0Y56_01530, partial [Nitrospira sp.]|nr:hypothetical protein [Nitrospira sp.]
MKLRHALQNILVLIASSFVGFLLLEIGLHLFMTPPPHQQPPTSFWQPHASLGWFLIPNKEGIWANQEFSNTIRINSAGFRDR